MRRVDFGVGNPGDSVLNASPSEGGADASEHRKNLGNAREKGDLIPTPQASLVYGSLEVCR
jgi:hypothetical protein